MGEEAGVTNTALTEIRSAVDLLHGRLAVIDTTQQSLMAQVNIMAEPVKDAAKTNADTVRHLSLLDQRLDSTSHTLERFTARSPSPEEDDPNPGDEAARGKSTLKTARVTWTGDTPGASSAGKLAGGRSEDLDSSHADGNSTATHGGGGGHGGAGEVDPVAQVAVDMEAQVAVDIGVMVFWGVLEVVVHIKAQIRQPSTS